MQRDWAVDGHVDVNAQTAVWPSLAGIRITALENDSVRWNAASRNPRNDRLISVGIDPPVRPALAPRFSRRNRLPCLRQVGRIERHQQQFLDLFEPGAIRTSGKTPLARVGDEVLQLVEEYFNQWSWFDEWRSATAAPIDRRAGQEYNFSHFGTPPGYWIPRAWCRLQVPIPARLRPEGLLLPLTWSVSFYQSDPLVW